MKLIQKIVFGFLALSLFAAIVGYVGFVSMGVVDEGFMALDRQTLPAINALKDAKASAAQLFSATMESALIEDGAHGEKEGISRIQGKNELNKSVEAYGALVDEFFPEEAALAGGLRESSLRFIERSDKIAGLKAGGAPSRDILEADEAFEEARDNLLGALDDALERKLAEIREREEIIAATITKSLVSIIIIIVISVVSAVISGTLFAHLIADPIIEMTKASSDAGRGYAPMRKVGYKSDDELGELTESFNKMIDGLKKRDEEISLKNRALEESKRALERKVAELGRFNKLSVGRELKMIELKKKIAGLEGKPKKQGGRK